MGPTPLPKREDEMSAAVKLKPFVEPLPGRCSGCGETVWLYLKPPGAVLFWFWGDELRRPHQCARDALRASAAEASA
jgi:hypothetical protein